MIYSKNKQFSKPERNLLGHTKSVNVRTARTDDAEAAFSVAPLRISAKPIEAIILRSLMPENVAAWIARPNNSVLMAILGERVVSVGAVTDAGEITLNHVAPQVRFRGVSRDMLAALEARARERGNRRCHLLSNETTCQFHLANGYGIAGLSWVKGGPRGSCPMSKGLLA